MAQQDLMMPGILVALGGGIVVAMAVWLGGGDGPEQRPDQAAPVVVGQGGGVRPDVVDPASRMDLDPRAGDEPLRLPGVLPEVETNPDDAARRAALPPPEPPPPLVEMTEEQKAAQAAYLALRERLAKDVGKQLGEQQSALRKACWKNTGGATSADFMVNASFGADGKLLGMGISDVRGPGDGDTTGVGQCLRQQAIALSVEEPGQGVSVDVPLHLP